MQIKQPQRPLQISQRQIQKYFSIGLTTGLAGNLGKLMEQAGGLGGVSGNTNAQARGQQIENYLQKFNNDSANATGMPS
ncbi:hypothetical protein [Helicobacter mustelae]|uniref:Putative Hsr recombination casette n=1 Tax=Helicobacter mustelae (strain ATCC 43772 / CCUG 25715 / CIP 103759 / LMG 18044 / NCTC 12198 / R85-136P) TaxID=679897 RepID=D3UI09_HELM1|nr:hypothetical protein [Helicobacter mustelae]CBG40132.1 putative Hsr recombination casette [Helicobacter mustelae 12198]STP12760.1 Hsr recombination casette protein [Helicobacter mustelae]